MRHTPNLKTEKFRKVGPPGSNCGMFLVPCKRHHQEVILKVQASDGLGWDHVSVSLPTRTPSWEEMEFVRGLFFRDDECVMQLSVPRSDNISYHDYCLHMWRPQTEEEIEALRKDYEFAHEYWEDNFARPRAHSQTTGLPRRP